MNSVPISAVLITHNEESNLPRALASLDWVDEVVVVDDGSNDQTIPIAQAAGCRVFHHPWQGFTEQKNYALDQASHDWVLSLDADEACTPSLKAAIQSWQQCPNPSQYEGFRISRRSWFLGQWICHTDWSPDYQLRFFRRSRGRWQGGAVHESVRVEGPVGILSGRIEHWPYADMGVYLQKLNNYSRLGAADLHQRGVRASLTKMLCNPAVAFIKSYFLKRGFLDGVGGFVVSVSSLVATFFRYVRLYELQLRPRSTQPDTHIHHSASDRKRS